MAAGHGGQVVLSRSTRELLDDSLDLCDLGEHRLKDLSGPRRLYQLGAGGFPPLKTLHRTNLPVPATAFLGRERELDELGALVQDGVRLLTLTGPGGVGKTRLALQAVAEAADAFPDGVWWVPLASVRDPGLVLSSVALALGVPEQPGREPRRDAGRRALHRACGPAARQPRASPPGRSGPGGGASRCRRGDSGRHEQGAAPALGRARVPGRAAGGAGSSRAVLRPDGRARSSMPATPSAVAELCARLDNLPLAVELAAARAGLLAPAEMLSRLGGRLDRLRGGRDADPRQQTLRATIAWSHDLLDEPEQELFARLAVFTGGGTLEAVEAVCDADLDVLSSLLDKSLVRRTDERVWMLETIREFASEQLDAHPDADELRDRHARYYLLVRRGFRP